MSCMHGVPWRLSWARATVNVAVSRLVGQWSGDVSMSRVDWTDVHGVYAVHKWATTQWTSSIDFTSDVDVHLCVGATLYTASRPTTTMFCRRLSQHRRRWHVNCRQSLMNSTSHRLRYVLAIRYMRLYTTHHSSLGSRYDETHEVYHGISTDGVMREGKAQCRRDDDVDSMTLKWRDVDVHSRDVARDKVTFQLTTSTLFTITSKLISVNGNCLVCHRYRR